MKKIVRLTESDLTRIVRRVIEEQTVVGAVANATEISTELLNLIINTIPAKVIISIIFDALVGNSKGVVDAFSKYKTQLGDDYQTLINAVTKGDLSKFASNLKKQASEGLGNQPVQRQSPPVRVEPQYSYKPTNQTTGQTPQRPVGQTTGGGLRQQPPTTVQRRPVR